MAIDYSTVRHLVNGETLDVEFVGRPLRDLIALLQSGIPANYYNKPEIDAMLSVQESDDALIYALIFGG